MAFSTRFTFVIAELCRTEWPNYNEVVKQENTMNRKEEKLARPNEQLKRKKDAESIMPPTTLACRELLDRADRRRQVTAKNTSCNTGRRFERADQEPRRSYAETLNLSQCYNALRTQNVCAIQLRTTTPHETSRHVKKTALAPAQDSHDTTKC